MNKISQAFLDINSLPLGDCTDLILQALHETDKGTHELSWPHPTLPEDNFFQDTSIIDDYRSLLPEAPGTVHKLTNEQIVSKAKMAIKECVALRLLPNFLLPNRTRNESLEYLTYPQIQDLILLLVFATDPKDETRKMDGRHKVTHLLASMYRCANASPEGLRHPERLMAYVFGVGAHDLIEDTEPRSPLMEEALLKALKHCYARNIPTSKQLPSEHWAYACRIPLLFTDEPSSSILSIADRLARQIVKAGQMNHDEKLARFIEKYSSLIGDYFVLLKCLDKGKTVGAYSIEQALDRGIARLPVIDELSSSQAKTKEGLAPVYQHQFREVIRGIAGIARKLEERGLISGRLRARDLDKELALTVQPQQRTASTKAQIPKRSYAADTGSLPEPFRNMDPLSRRRHFRSSNYNFFFFSLKT